MGLETATYLDELVSTNPVGSTDTVSTLDDHIRLIKAVLLATFPNLSGAMTSNETELNLLDGRTDVGYLGLPVVVDNDAHTFALTEAGGMVVKESGSAATWTIPANASVAFPVGSAITLLNRDDSDITLTITSDTLTLAGEGTTADVTIPQYAMCTIVKVDTTVWYVSGNGIS